MRSSNFSISHLFVSAVLSLMLLLTNVGTVAAAPLSNARRSCDRAVRFSRDDFPHPTRINNEFMPLIPGTQLVFNGVITTSGQAVDHQVIFTVTDLIKIIDGVRTRVIYDVDVNEGEVAEAELAFFAQDEDGNVWNLGEYPEEYEGGEFVGAPSTWINGQADARGGIHMFGKPLSQLGRSTYLQGIAPDIEFLDCGQVVDKDQSVNGYDDVLVTYETSPLDPEGGTQIKYYAPGVGIVQIGALDDPEGETMILTDVVDLNADQMDQIRAEALALDTHAYEVSEVYQSTPPAYKHHQDDGNSDSIWYISNVGSFPFGMQGDIPVEADYNGDGKDDIAVFRPSTSTWYIDGLGSFVFGTVDDIPVVGDYNGDAKADIAVFRPSNSTWYVSGVGTFVYGTVGDIPVVADYDGDGKDDIAVFRPSTSTWYIWGVGSYTFGTVGDIPVVADYDGDGKDDIAVFRPSNSTWYISGIGSFVFGTVDDIPVVGDYNGDAKADIAVFRP